MPYRLHISNSNRESCTRGSLLFRLATHWVVVFPSPALLAGYPAATALVATVAAKRPTVGGGVAATPMVNALPAVCGSEDESVTPAVKAKLPAVVGVPVICPLAASVRPAAGNRDLPILDRLIAAGADVNA